MLRSNKDKNINKTGESNKILKWFRNLSFKKKLIVSFLVVSVIPTLILQIVYQYNTTLSMEKKINELISENLVQASKNLNTTLNSYTDVLYQIYIDDEIIDMVGKMNEGTHDEQVVAFNVINGKLKNLVSAKAGIRSIAILCANGMTAFYDSVTVSSVETIWNKYKDVREAPAYKKAAGSNQMVLIPTEFEENYRGNYYMFHIAKKMHNFKNLNKGGIGVAVLSIDEDVIFKACNEIEQTKGVLKNKSSINFIIDNEGNIITYPDKRFVGTSINEFTGSLEEGLKAKANRLVKESMIFAGKPVIINSYFDKQTNWTIVNAVDQNYLFSDIYWLQSITVLIGLAVIIFSITLIIFISNGFSRSIGKIVEAMKTAQEGELSVQVEVEQNDEFSLIAKRFNRMIFRLNMLVDQVKQAAHKQKEAEIRALEAQINPHFLYNTLDSINWMAIEKEEHDISRMLKSLAQILRYSINKSNKIVTVREELEWLKQYIYLQQNRFNFSFECKVYANEDVMDLCIHKLLFQPFIENTIVHGFEGFSKGGLLEIRINQGEDRMLNIEIEDNGKGIKEEVLAMINSSRLDDIESEGTGLGIKNVFNRILMYYGDKVRWNVESTLGKGTKISLVIPIMDKRDEL